MIEEIQRTKENWTYGIINIPLLYGHDNRHGVNPRSILRKVAHNAKCYKTPFPCLDKTKRYLWFELDTKDEIDHIEVLEYFRDKYIDVFWHHSMRGYHYVTLKTLTIAEHEREIVFLKDLFDNITFSYALRIIPNKWVGEANPYIWYKGEIECNGSKHSKELQYIQHAFNQPYIFNYNRTTPPTVTLLDNMFCISRYEFKKGLQI